MRLSSRLLKNTFAPRIALQSHAQEEVLIAFSQERRDLIFEGLISYMSLNFIKCTRYESKLFFCPI